MKSKTRDDYLSFLERVNAQLCAYSWKRDSRGNLVLVGFCDCKFGATDIGNSGEAGAH